VDSGRGIIGVALKGDRQRGPHLRILRLKNRETIVSTMPNIPAAVRELDVSILHTLVFERIFRIRPDEVRQGGNIEYTIDASTALAEVETGTADGAFLMTAPTVHDVERVCHTGATMPEKSTYFFPKLLTGLVMNRLETDEPGA
jgi:uncharacterized protein (DUF1015 family)